MGIDFAKLVLGPCLAVFAQAVSYNPLVSSPGAPAFAARGIFDAEHELVTDLDGVDHSTQGPVLGIALSEFAEAPQAGDRVTINGQAYQVWDVRPDGQGKADLILKVV